LEYLNVTLGTNAIPTATVLLKTDGKKIEESATGDGPVDACFNAIDRALGTKSHIESYQVRSITGGRQAQGEVLVRVRKGEQSFVGKGFSTDIIEASAKAYLKALEEQYLMTEKREFLEMAATL
jgi:2-isopropylmalate synthase